MVGGGWQVTCTHQGQGLALTSPRDRKAFFLLPPLLPLTCQSSLPLPSPSHSLLSPAQSPHTSVPSPGYWVTGVSSHSLLAHSLTFQVSLGHGPAAPLKTPELERVGWGTRGTSWIGGVARLLGESEIKSWFHELTPVTLGSSFTPRASVSSSVNDNDNPYS